LNRAIGDGQVFDLRHALPLVFHALDALQEVIQPLDDRFHAGDGLGIPDGPVPVCLLECRDPGIVALELQRVGLQLVGRREVGDDGGDEGHRDHEHEPGDDLRGVQETPRFAWLLLELPVMTPVTASRIALVHGVGLPLVGDL
jgi:hypothetical protein